MIYYNNGYKIIEENKIQTIDKSVTVIGPDFEEVKLLPNAPRPIVYGQISYTVKIKELDGICIETRYFVRTGEFKDVPVGSVEDDEVFSNYKENINIVLPKVRKT